MVAFQFRMGAGFAGDVNRSHPMSIEPVKIDAAAPPLGYGLAVVVDPTTQGVRQMAAGDTALTDIYGIAVRPFPSQGNTLADGSAPFGGGTPPASGAMDVLRSGYIMVPIVGTPVKGAAVNVWVAATGGGHVQGGFEAATSGGNTITLSASTTTFQGGVDSNGIGEVIFHV